MILYLITLIMSGNLAYQTNPKLDRYKKSTHPKVQSPCNKGSSYLLFMELDIRTIEKAI